MADEWKRVEPDGVIYCTGCGGALDRVPRKSVAMVRPCPQISEHILPASQTPICHRCKTRWEIRWQAA